MTSITTYTPFIPDQYCVYHTTYSGTLLPQNYIDSTYVDRILIQKYHGSVASKRYKAIWESEIKLHPELFLTAIVSYHDTRPNATYKELQKGKTKAPFQFLLQLYMFSLFNSKVKVLI